jgi:TM2 domain-containing membrane protein YozV
VRRDEVVGILLALFLGTFGVHHFYLRRTGLGILYLHAFSGRGLRLFSGFVECFFMPGRVREFNAIQAAGIAAALGIPAAGVGPAAECDGEHAADRIRRAPPSRERRSPAGGASRPIRRVRGSARLAGERWCRLF